MDQPRSAHRQRLSGCNGKIINVFLFKKSINTLIHGQVFSGVDSDRFQLNHHSLWTGGPFQNKSYTGNNADPSQKSNKAAGIASLRKEIWSKGQVPVEDATTLYGSFGTFDKN